MKVLRYYQAKAINTVLAYWQDGGKNPLVSMATGTGKSLVIASLAKQLIEEWDPKIRVLNLVHVKELVRQNVQEMLRAWPAAPIGINSASLNRRDTRQQILFASIQSVFRNPTALGPRHLIIVDECHLIPRSGSGMYLKLFAKLQELYPKLRIVGLTATPYRLDSGRMDEGDDRLFNELVYDYDIAQGVEDGYLSPLVSKCGKVEIDTSSVHKRGGEFIASELEAAADDRELTNSACDEIVARGKDRKAWLIFCTGIAHANHVRDAIKERGITCEAVTSEMSGHDYDRVVKAYREGKIQCLTNANMLTTGFDVPHVDMLAGLRPTMSTGLYVQMMGRGTRLSEGKLNCLVLDFAGNVMRHGPVDAVSVKTKDKTLATDTPPPQKICPECMTFNHAAARTCIACGFEWPKTPLKHGRKPEEIPIMTRDIKDHWIDVRDVTVRHHQKEGKPPVLRVDYLIGYNTISEWVCLEHKSFASEIGRRWWRAMTGTAAPQTVAEALTLVHKLPKVHAVTRVRDGEFWRIGKKLVTVSGRDIIVDEKGRLKFPDADAKTKITDLPAQMRAETYREAVPF